MELTNLYSVSATEVARLIRDGVVSSEQFVEACLARIAEVDGQIQAWAFLDPEYALTQARAADQRRLSGSPIGPLHGVPMASKIFSIPPTCRLNMVRRFTPGARRRAMPAWSQCCARREQ